MLGTALSLLMLEATHSSSVSHSIFTAILHRRCYFLHLMGGGMLRFRKTGQPNYHPLVRVIHLSVHLSIHPPIHLTIYSSIYPSSTYPFIYPSIHPSIHPPLDQQQYLLIMFHVLLGTKGITGERDTWSSALMELSV